MKVHIVFVVMFQLLWRMHSAAQTDSVFIKYNAEPDADVPMYTTDTVLFETSNARQLLYGTMVLPNTEGQGRLKNAGWWLEGVTLSPCKSEGKRSNNAITDVAVFDSTATIEIKIWGNCCHSFLCDVELENDSLLVLKYHGYGKSYCFCDCCFGLTYHFHLENAVEGIGIKAVMVDKETSTKRSIASVRRY